MCVVPSLSLVLSNLTEEFSLICMNYLQICQIVLAASFILSLKLFEGRVVQRSQVFNNEDVTIFLRIVDAQLFWFGTRIF